VRSPRGGSSARRDAGALETGRHVFIRTPVRHDAPALAELARASLRLHHPWVYPPTNTATVARWLRTTGPNRHRLLVCRRGDGAIVGVVNVSEIVRSAFQSAYLGYYAFRPHAGQGYMTQGLALVLRHAFATLGLHRLEANIQPANHPSRALVRGLGFRKEGFSPRYLKIGGRWRDHERWAMVREGWTRTASHARRGGASSRVGAPTSARTRRARA
jgi:[ribosomal protein S5]-alanine N-acetyltransferase